MWGCYNTELGDMREGRIDLVLTPLSLLLVTVFFSTSIYVCTYK